MDNTELTSNPGSVETVMNIQEMTGAICGTVLGDGYLHKGPRYKNAYLRIEHCKEQEDYLDYKIRIFSELCRTRKRYGVHYHPERTTVRLFTRCHPLLTKLQQWFYATGKKRITNRILYSLTPLGLALWYMDDGYLGYIKKHGVIRGREIKLYTCALPIEDQQLIVDYFKAKWGITWRIGRSKLQGKEMFHLACGAVEGTKFLKLVEPYVPDSMSYKLDMKYRYSSYAGQPVGGLMRQSELGRNPKPATEMIAAQQIAV